MGPRARALYFTAPGQVELRSEECADAGGQVLVESTLIGISHGTEMLFYKGPFPSGSRLESFADLAAQDYPLKYGYINVGRCADGRRVFAFQPHQDRFCVDPDDLVTLPDDVSDDNAVFFASMETALQITHDAAPRLGEVALVVGLGVIGQLVCRLLARTGATVIAAEPIAARREAAAHHVRAVIDPMTEHGGGHPRADQTLKQITGGRGADLAINTSACGDGLQFALDHLAIEGTLVEASWYGARSVDVNLGAAFHRKRLTVRSSQVSRLNPAMQPRWTHERRSEQVLELLQTVEPAALITHRFPLDAAAQAFHLISSRPEEVLQVVLEP